MRESQNSLPCVYSHGASTLRPADLLALILLVQDLQPSQGNTEEEEDDSDRPQVSQHKGGIRLTTLRWKNSGTGGLEGCTDPESWRWFETHVKAKHAVSLDT